MFMKNVRSFLLAFVSLIVLPAIVLFLIIFAGMQLQFSPWVYVALIVVFSFFYVLYVFKIAKHFRTVSHRADQSPKE